MQLLKLAEDTIQQVYFQNKIKTKLLTPTDSYIFQSFNLQIIQILERKIIILLFLDQITWQFKLKKNIQITGFEAIVNEYKTKAEKYKYYFFDKGELIEQYRLKDYDDLILIFKFKEQWYASIWKIAENEIYLIDYKTNYEESLANTTQLVKEFHKKFFDFQVPSKGIVILPDNNSYRVSNEKEDDCGDLCMGFIYLYSIGSLVIEIKLTPSKRANFSISFGWLLLKIYHEEEYNFKKNINKALPSKVEILVQKDSYETSYDSIKEELKKREQQELEEGYGFKEIFLGGGDGLQKLPQKNTVFKDIVRYTPIPNKDDVSLDKENEDNQSSEEDYRKKIIVVASQKDRDELEEARLKSTSQYNQLKSDKILNSQELEPYEFFKTTSQNQSYLLKPAFNQQNRRTANSKINQDSFALRQDNYWEDLQRQSQQEIPGSKKKIFQSSDSQFKKVGDQILSNSSFLNKDISIGYDSQNQMRKSQEPQKKQQQQQVMPKMSKQEFEKQKREMENRLKQINQQFVKKEDLLDILDDVKREVNFEMKLQMRQISEDLKLEREKKEVEEEFRKKHFEDYFHFLLNYYQQNDLKQYYQLLEEYNNRLRQMAITNLPSTMFQTPSSQYNQNGFIPPQYRNKNGDNLYDGYFNRGTNKFGFPLSKMPKDTWGIEPKYLNYDNDFRNGNLKVPKDAEFSNPGFNGFAISPEKKDKEKKRIDMFLEDNMKIAQVKVDRINQALKQKEIQKQVEEESLQVQTSNKGLKLFGGDYYKQQKIQNQLEQERKYQELLLNPNRQITTDKLSTQNKFYKTNNSNDNKSNFQSSQKIQDTFFMTKNTDQLSQNSRNQNTQFDNQSGRNSQQSLVKLINTQNYI